MMMLSCRSVSNPLGKHESCERDKLIQAHGKGCFWFSRWWTGFPDIPPMFPLNWTYHVQIPIYRRDAALKRGSQFRIYSSCSFCRGGGRINNIIIISVSRVRDRNPVNWNVLRWVGLRNWGRKEGWITVVVLIWESKLNYPNEGRWRESGLFIILLKKDSWTLPSQS